ncbi:MAG: hypothetical protein ABI548_02205 [Polyangiaceae bacterium]
MLVPILPLLGCSLMGLDDFGGAPCTLDTDCAKAEAQLRPGAAACGSAVCLGGLCKWQAGKEVCNGKDDDCNGLIDEGLGDGGQASSFPADSSTGLAYALASERGPAFLAVQPGAGSSQGFALPDGQPKELRYDSALGLMNCPTTQAQVASKATAVCNFSEVALAADTLHLVVASINTDGCAAGQVRVGLSDIDSAPFDVWLGKRDGEPSEDPDTIGFGVDIDEQGCTGASRSADATGMPVHGATRPAVASLGTEAGGKGALLLWLAAPANISNAPTDSIPVEALGLVVPTDQPLWLNGMNQGRPTELGMSTTVSAPAVVALKSASEPGKYLVAFPAEQEAKPGIQLLTVRSDEAKLPKLLVEPLVFLAARAADQVSLTLGNTERAEVGVAWRTGTGAEAKLCLTVVSTSGAILSPAETCIPTPAPALAPQLLYRQAGFAQAEPRGGWFLSWVEAVGNDEQKFRVARYREGALKPLGDSTLQAAGIALLYPSKDDDWSVGYAVVQPANGKIDLKTTPLWCQ